MKTTSKTCLVSKIKCRGSSETCFDKVWRLYGPCLRGKRPFKVLRTDVCMYVCMYLCTNVQMYECTDVVVPVAMPRGSAKSDIVGLRDTCFFLLLDGASFVPGPVAMVSYSCWRTYVRTYVRTHACTYVYTDVRTYVRTYVRSHIGLGLFSKELSSRISDQWLAKQTKWSSSVDPILICFFRLRHIRRRENKGWATKRQTKNETP